MASGAHDLDAHLQLRTDEHALEGILRIGPKAPTEYIDEGTFVVFLESRGISSRMICRDAIRSLVAEVIETPGAEHAVVAARGVAPRDGARRVLEWSPEIAAQIERIAARKQALDEEAKPAKRAAAETEEAVNFYEQSAFIIVQSGQVLGSVSPPDPGEDGEDIFGNSVPAKQSPAPSELNPETIELTRDHKVIALARGRLIFSGPDRRIERTLTISEDVGFETGNVDFPGSVEIGGGVRDKFIVKASGNISVRKLVEASYLDARRDIVLDRGAAGREIGKIVTGLDLRAGYLEGVRVECGQDCVVRHEITNCHVGTRGSIKIPTGAVRGGVLSPAKGMEAGVVGSSQETRTEVLLAALVELEALLQQARDRISETKSAMEPVIARHEMLKSSTGGKPTAEQIETMMSIEFAISEGNRRISDLEDAAARLEANLQESTSPVLRVTQCINAGVILWLPGFKATFRNELKGESIIRMSDLNKPVIEYRGETQPLSKFATVEPDSRVLARPCKSTSPTDQRAA